MARWATQNLTVAADSAVPDVDLVRPADPLDEIAATLLYPTSSVPFRCLMDEVSGWSRARRREVLDVALEDRDSREELLREFRSGYAYVFDVVCDIGAYRDLHRHRRCQQIQQTFTDQLGFETPELLAEAGAEASYLEAIEEVAEARRTIAAVSQQASHYLLPFAARVRSLFKMDFAEAEYIARVRSGVKGHISYRTVAWQMRERIMEREPRLGDLIQATPPSVEDALVR